MTARTPHQGFEVICRLLGFGRAGDGYVVAPRVDSPRFVIPVGTRAAARSACWSYHRLRGRKASTARMGAGLALSVPGIDRRLLPDRIGPVVDGDLASRLSTEFGEPVLLAVGFGAVDEWWTPTLHLFAEDGRVLGFAKLGWTPLTRRQVINEAAALDALDADPLPDLIVPRVTARLTLDDGPSGSVEIVVTSPLPADLRSLEGTEAPPLGPLLALAEGLPGPTVALADGGFWRRMLDDLAPLRNHPAVDPDRRLADAIEAVSNRVGDVIVPTSRFHGDYAGWNLGVDGRGRLALFDWEHSDPEGPVGLDLCHGVVQNEFRRGLAEGRDDLRRLTADAVRAVDSRAAHDRLRGLGLDDAQADALRLVEPLFGLSLVGRAVRFGVEPSSSRPEVLGGVLDALEAMR